MLITLIYFCLIKLSIGVKNVCFKCNSTGTETLGRNRVLNGVPSLKLQHGQEIALCQNETGHTYCQAQGHLSTPFSSCEVYKPQRGPLDMVCVWPNGLPTIKLYAQSPMS